MKEGIFELVVGIDLASNWPDLHLLMTWTCALLGEGEPAVVEEIQQSVSLWKTLLPAMDGTLVPEKCFWYLIDFASHGS